MLELSASAAEMDPPSCVAVNRSAISDDSLCSIRSCVVVGGSYYNVAGLIGVSQRC